MIEAPPAPPSSSAPAEVRGDARRPRAGAAAIVLAGLLVALVLAGAWHLTQGTSAVGVRDLVDLVLGRAPSHDSTATTREILTGSRLPRLAAGIAVGFALGVGGALLQSLARNAMASPDTLAVTGGAYFAVTLVAALGLSVPLWASGLTAFAGGVVAAGVVLALAGGAGTSTTRLILAGSAVALALQAGTSTLLILFQEETTSLFAWGSGSLSQLGLRAFTQAAPVVLVATLAGLLLARRLDLLAMGDDSAAVLGVPVRSTRAIGTVLAVLLVASSVTLAGPIGFVGLCAPVIARLLGKVVPAMLRHAVLLPAAGLLGALIVIVADVAVRAAVGADAAMSVPTGVTTTIFGAVVMVLLARGSRDAGPSRQPPAAAVAARGRTRFVVVLLVVATMTAGVVVLGLLAGHQWLYLGDVSAWLRGEGLPLVRFALDERAPRVAAALLAGGALALAGAIVQATCRNPLAEPGILGITGGAGLGAVVVVTGLGSGFSSGTSAGASATTMLMAATVGSLVAFSLVYGLAWRGGLDADRLVLIGIGVWYATMSLSTFLLVRSNPWDTPRIYTWLSGSTYGRSWEQVVPVAIALAVALPLTFVVRRELDLLALDEDTPRLVGVSLEKVRLLVLATAAVLTAMAVSAVGVVGFVGLVAPHIARALVGGRSARVVPVAVLVGALLLVVADTIGRTVISPAQVPAGLVVALIGAPYFVYLLARSRA
ncbi:iron ABC transporter permease [Nocardioides jishulii]|uniref:Iron ABC transporter permease n=1 Tax=Nocardioides jishulii TaxID=2575440 RepID=A0A4U2YM19_9ACTN|nr:iron ABC transporter permease [Nocardioides jishulii]QCX28136.1 iron ABC transporter permease [Nocardioides jishulii]TKI60801.1 iron ABC transporter permease [Nocardioides jishulii]